MRVFLIATLMLLTLGCTGPEGPMGPQGEPGPGTLILIEGTTPIPSDEWCRNVPQIDLDNMPLITIYVTIGADPNFWVELPYYFEGWPDWGFLCYFYEDYVCFLNCQGEYYKIVIVT